MAMSSATGVPPAEESDPASYVTRNQVPNLPAMDNTNQEDKLQSTQHTYRWKVSFPAPSDKVVAPRSKFAPFLSMITSQWPTTTLNPWEPTSKQVITTGVDLPYEKKDLIIYIPHDRRKQRLESSWHITSEVLLHEMKANPVFMKHLKVNNIFVNATNVQSKSSEIYGWFALSHPKHTSRDDSANELSLRLNVDVSFDIHQYLVRIRSDKNKEVCTTRALVIAGPSDKKQEIRGKLYTLSNISEEEQLRWPQTGKWVFLPFTPDGDITLEQLVDSTCAQNDFLATQRSIAVTGFTEIDSYVTNPETNIDSHEGTADDTICFRSWLLQQPAKDGDFLITSVERGPPGVHFFCTHKDRKKELETWIDEFNENIGHYFTYEDISAVTEDNTIERRFKIKASENTKDGASAITKFLSQTSIMKNSPKLKKVDNCWSSPRKFQYSQQDEDHYDDDEIVGITEDAEANDIMDNDVFLQEVIRKADEAEKTAAQMLTSTQKTDKALQNMLERTQALETAQISSNDDQLKNLLEKTKEIARKNLEFDEWKQALDQDLNKRFKDQEEVIEKKLEEQNFAADERAEEINAKLDKISSSMESTHIKFSDNEKKFEGIYQVLSSLQTDMSKFQSNLDTVREVAATKAQSKHSIPVTPTSTPETMAKVVKRGASNTNRASEPVTDGSIKKRIRSSKTLNSIHEYIMSEPKSPAAMRSRRTDD
jgi:hypothetical protein